MSIGLDWQEIAIRLLLSFICGAAFGINRGEHARPAGLRTTTLVCLAACIAMLQANSLMNTNGKGSGSFVVLDLMRLPLGILSGIGFIGAGTILKRGDTIEGVTTAATLWFVTVLGLCFGGGQIGLGLSSLALGLAAILGLRRLELRIHQDRHAILALVLEQKGLSDSEVRSEIHANGFHIDSCTSSVHPREATRQLEYLLKWRAHTDPSSIPRIFESLSQRKDVITIGWRPKEIQKS